MPPLASPLRLGRLELKNRLVMPPMVLFKPKSADWQPDRSHLEYYEKRAQAGTGLIVVEATAVAPGGRLAPFQLRAWEDSQIEALAGIARAIKRHRAAALVQIHHAGANTRPEYLDGAAPVSPSGIPPERGDGGTPRAMTGEEIAAAIEAFAAAARRCLQAGFDGVELHGAHGYLLSQFLSPAFNHRRDEWGGPALHQRLSFPLAVARAVRAAMGERALLGYRLGAAEFFEGGLPLSEGIEAARVLAGSGLVDVLHVSHGMGGGDWPAPPADFPFGTLMWLGAQVKKAVNIPVIAVGGIRTGADAQTALDLGVGDLIAAGRAMLADPLWTAKALARRDGELALCRSCARCLHFTRADRCPARAQAGASVSPRGPNPSASTG